MEAGLIALIVLAAIGCLLLGVNIIKMKSKDVSIQGTLNVDCRDSENGPCLFLALDVPVEEVASKKKVLFDVRIIK